MNKYLENVMKEIKNKQYGEEFDKTSKSSGGILTFPNGFSNPILGFRSKGLTTKNKQILNNASANRLKNTSFSEIPTSFFRDFRVVNKELAKINPSTSNFVREMSSNYKTLLDNYDKNSSLVKYENIFRPAANILVNMNNYRFAYNAPLSVFSAAEIKDSKMTRHYAIGQVAPSLFNPLYFIHTIEITPGVPLLSNKMSSEGSNITDCSTRSLVEESYKQQSILGLARYRYSDFMYCKDLGKISNNHLITLRRFVYPVTDNIFKEYDDGAGDIGRLVTWFGTEDNKLEDILNYEYEMTWKPLEAKIEEINSKEDSDNRGPLGKLINSFNPQYNKSVLAGHSGSHSLWKWGFGNDDNAEVLRNYDNNKVYTPKNTIQDTHVYEGKLKFNHEFTLKFHYQLRAYDNINPKSAMLDLIGNILNVTYRRGKFWGGDRKFIGSPQNTSGWERANALIDSAWAKAGGVLAGLGSGTLSFGDILGSISNLAGIVGSAIADGWNNIYSAAKNGQLPNKVQELFKKTGIDEAALGMIKNKLGRPALYAMDSLLKGDNVGLWHVTIGNPKNPIAAMGNLILTKASIQHTGPLGIDDFPSEIIVTATLKHARSRDSIEIERMYTKGMSAIYFAHHNKGIGNHFMSGAGGSLAQTKLEIDEQGNVRDTGEYLDNQVTKDKDGKITASSNTIGVNTLKGEDRAAEVKRLNELANKPIISNGINITGFAGTIDQHNQLLNCDLALVLDELA